MTTECKGCVQLDADLWQVMDERDRREALLDEMADAVAAFLGIDLGEHSSSNCPWRNAIEALKERSV